MTPALRLRPLVEAIEDADGAVYLLRGPAGGDCVVRRPPAALLPLVRALERGGSTGELARTVRAGGHDVEEHDVAVMVAELAAAELLEPVTAVDDGRLARQALYLRDRAPAGTSAAAMQRRLRAAHVVVLGCGGLGSWAATGLACVGIGRLTLVDDDVVERSNLNRQLLFTERDIGRAKVDAAAEALQAFDSGLVVEPVRSRLRGEDDVRAAVHGASFVLACADEPPYRIARWIDAACRREGVPHIGAGQLPPIVRVGPTVVPGRTACLGCLELQLREDNPLYDRLEAARSADPRKHATLGPASGVGQLIATEVLHQLTGMATPATAGAVWTMDLRTLTSELTPVAARRECPCGAAAP